MAINGAASIDQWVAACQAAGIEFHAWAVPLGLNIDAEAALIVDACKRPGVQSLILDIRALRRLLARRRLRRAPIHARLAPWFGHALPYRLERRSAPPALPYGLPARMEPLRRQRPSTVRIGTPFARRRKKTLASVWNVWGGYDKPIIPVLEGTAPAQDQTEAHTLATQVHGAKGISWWRHGVISQWTGPNTPVDLASSPADTPSDIVQNFADEVIIFPSRQGFRSGTYTGQPEFSARQNTWGWDYLYVTTEERTSKVWAEWRDQLPRNGLYEIAVFIPNRKATTARARYKVHGIVGTTTEVVVDINQNQNRNRWVALGVFDLDRSMENAGRVFLNDVTGEPDKEIAFDAVRFRRIVSTPAGYTPAPEPPRPTVIDGVHVADGYDSPVGASEQRRGDTVWPPGWRDATPFGKLYFIGTPSEAYHTGADLNFGAPYADKGMACYACASGVVLVAARFGRLGQSGGHPA